MMTTLIAGVVGLAASLTVPSEYEFVEINVRQVLIYRGSFQLVGSLDRDGNFHEAERFYRGVALSGPITPLINIGNQNTKKAFEFRSGRLIPGEIDQKGNFVPELSGKIISFKDYRPGPNATPIWNLPGLFVKKQTKQR